MSNVTCNFDTLDAVYLLLQRKMNGHYEEVIWFLLGRSHMVSSWKKTFWDVEEWVID